MLAVKVRRKVSCRAYGSIELTSPELAHRNVLASAAVAAKPAQTTAASANERRKLIVIQNPLAERRPVPRAAGFDPQPRGGANAAANCTGAVSPSIPQKFGCRMTREKTGVIRWTCSFRALIVRTSCFLEVWP